MDWHIFYLVELLMLISVYKDALRAPPLLIVILIFLELAQSL